MNIIIVNGLVDLKIALDDNRGTGYSSIPILRDFTSLYQKKSESSEIRERLGSNIVINDQQMLNSSISLVDQPIFSISADLKDPKSPWPDPEWSCRKNITIDSSFVRDDLKNFPLLLDLYDADLKVFALPDGADIKFTQISGEQLNHEIELFEQNYNVSHSHLVAWVQVNLSRSQDTLISMYFGNNNATNQERPENVWSDDYIAVWHLNEFGNGTNEYSDSTSNNNDGQDIGSPPTQVPGKIGDGQFFNGIDNLILVPSSTSLLSPMNEITIEGWVYSTDNSPGGSIVSMNEGYGLDFQDERIWAHLNGTSADPWFTGVNAISGWHHYVFTYDGSINDINVLLIDGSPVSGTINSGKIQSSGSLHIGWTNWTSQFTKGIIDEVRISNITKTFEWIETEFNNQNNPSSFYSIEPMEIFDGKSPEINDFGVEDPGTGFPQFWANVTDFISTVDFVTLKLNMTEYNMTLNGTDLWIYQPSIITFNDFFTYQISNASDSMRNYIAIPSIQKNCTFNYDNVTPSVKDWEYFSDEGIYGAFKANVSDSWGNIDSVIVNVTEGTVPQGNRWAIMQESASGHINDTIIMESGQIKFVITVNDTAGNSFTSSEHQGFVPVVLNHAPAALNLTLSRDQNVVLLPIYSNSTLYLEYDFYDEDNDSDMGTEISWYKNGVLQAAYNNSKSIPSSVLIKDDQWNATVRPKDGVDFGPLNVTNIIIIQNTPPTLSNVNISPGNPVTTSTLSINYVYTDYDGDIENTGSREIRWYNDSTLMVDYNDNTSISSSITKKGDEWYCQIRIHDGENFSNIITSDVVTINNLPPIVTNPTYNKTSDVTTDDTINITYTFSDSDSNDLEDTDKRIVYWFRDGLYNQSKDNDTILYSNETSQNEFWYYKIKIHDGTEYSLNYTSSPVIIGTPLNDPPVAENLTLTINPFTNDNLVADYDYYDNQSHSEAGTQIRWYNNDQLQVHLNDSMIVQGSETTKDEIWFFTILPKDGLDFGELAQSYNVTIVNSPPTASDLLITSYPKTGDDLEADWNYEDIDGDSESSSWIITWYKDNQEQGTFNNLITVPFNATTKNEVWNYTIKVFDGENYSIQYNSSTTTIINSPPTASGVFLNIDPVTKDNLTVSYIFQDVDSDDENSSWIIRWFKNSNLQKELNDSKIVSFGNTSKNEIWYYKIMIYDGENYSSNFYFSPSRIINNTIPTLSNLSITSNPPTFTELEASWTFQDDDGDYESILRIINWYKNGVHRPVWDNKLYVLSSATSKGEVWNYTVKVFDGTHYSIQYNSSLTIIQNTPSNIIKVEINDNSSSTFADTSLEVIWDISDLDGDLEVEFTTFWYVNGNYQVNLTNQTSILPFELSKGEFWHCVIQVFDGESWSQNKTSQTIEIINKAPMVTSLQLQESISPDFQIDDINLNITYLFVDIDNDDDLSMIRWYVNGTPLPQYDSRHSIPANETNPGETWVVEVYPFDGSENSTMVSMSIFIEGRPSINNYGFDILKDIEGHYLIWVNVTDSQNSLKIDNEVQFEILVNGSILLLEDGGQKNGTMNFWVLDYQIDNFSYLDSPLEIIITATREVTYSQIYDISIQERFSLLQEDKAAPRVLKVYYEFNDEENPSNLNFTAEIEEFGSGIFNVVLFFRYESSNDTNGGNGANIFQEEKWSEAPMTFQYENLSGKFKVFSTTVDFSPISDTIISFWIKTADNQGNIKGDDTSFSEFSYEIPADTLEWSDLIPLFGLVGLIPIFLFTIGLIARKRHQTRIKARSIKQKEIVEKGTDILSLRVLICRNHCGVAFYSENFGEGGQDEHMIAGITSAFSSMVSEIAQREVNSGEFDTLEREAFYILSYHGNYCTISMISEEKLSTFMRMKMELLASQIENLFTKEELEGLITPEMTQKTKNIVYKTLPLGLLKPLTVDLTLLKNNMYIFKKNERKWFDLIAEIPSFIDGQQAFSAITFISSLTVHGIPLVKAFSFLDRCYTLRIIRNISEEELNFLDSTTSYPD
ncbi:MAG: DUF2341 domain-containing protein [Candidatus Hodarchaeales archaeon]